MRTYIYAFLRQINILQQFSWKIFSVVEPKSILFENLIVTEDQDG